MSLALGLGLASAQHTAPAASTTTHQVAKTTKTAVKDVKAAKPATAPTAAKMKKDGTPDKRYKENKHLKADGTPDKRYKENK